MAQTNKVRHALLTFLLLSTPLPATRSLCPSRTSWRVKPRMFLWIQRSLSRYVSAQISSPTKITSRNTHRDALTHSNAIVFLPAGLGLVWVGKQVITAETSPNPWPTIPASENHKNVAIFTSGGDAQGMNAAVRAAAGVCLKYGANVYAIHNVGDSSGFYFMKRSPHPHTCSSTHLLIHSHHGSQGYQGMVDGGECIEQLTWTSICDIMHRVRSPYHACTHTPTRQHTNTPTYKAHKTSKK